MTIAIGNDHAGTEYKFEIIKFLEKQGHKVINFGTNDSNSMDYPDAIHPTAEAVETKQAEMGIILCGSGNGAQMTANKHQGVRAALCWNNELVALTRQHNNANILTIPARFVSLQQALGFVTIFLNTEFEGGRHANRVNKIACDCL
ncbi:ribose 5-phosphate isomerase B [Tenacibaculum dicentrarchi]|uniref:Ribose-5-phosphate isomerase B n=2 Tax=Tenacibaculum dicentrarchi TaxID=669041 RepID=A0ABM9P350_9FLAO|nr:ribose 5-phosphate isomerase B [Tenacibaculum dicentrarchi]MCD8407084.1 ribose 5-phosphate isomerase B [Tenacibaculum dicentrarchi]MCD8413939.1 ribose 5-phosphate isomerase B [Tenacibaculum dicentrarchi]MCD8419423.1 ribose 5-phosphate isomerase B [Tenacibaculum dicentrarchi]MCD8424439.1 ribose 5-phosphate isomerase B [Tenacibaculum dicentrarchi]